MRKLSCVVVVGFMLNACGGGEENQAPKTPAAPTETAPAVAPPVAEAPKEEKPKETLAQLEEKTGRGMFEAMNAHDSKKLAGFYAEGGVVKVAGAPADASGREAIAQSYDKLFAAFPDYKAMPTRIFAKGDVVVVEWIFNGTHNGDLWGMKATEKKVGAQGIDIMWFTPEGMVKEHHVYYDGATILSQIGVSKAKARPIPAMPGDKPQMFVSKDTPDEAKNMDAAKTMGMAMETKKEADFLGGLADTVEWDDMAQPQTSKGKTDAKKYFKEMTTAFPDAKMMVTNTWAFGDFVVTEGQWTGTHKGAFFGMQPTKKSVTMKSVDVEQFKDGKLVHGWGYENGADFMMQLGQMPKPGATKDAKVTAANPDKKPVTPAKPATPATTAKKP